MMERRSYFDWNASAPLRCEARAAMIATLGEAGNASSVHAEGRRARAIVEDAREQVAQLIGADPSEVVFTSGATEANNWSVRAGWDALFVCGVEHESVLASARSAGAQAIALTVDRNGVIELASIEEQIARAGPSIGRALITLQMANNETGVVQPLSDVISVAREHGLTIHTDATQAAGRLPIDFHTLGIDLLSISSHKLGGPKGVGALVVGEDCALAPMMLGGAQERRRRAGTENVAAIAGFGAAAVAALADLDRVEEVAAQRDRIEQALVRLTPDIVVVGAGARRIANTSCIAWPGYSAETLVIEFDLAGIGVGAGSACSSGKVGPSHVLAAMGLPNEIARSAIRISLGPATSEEDVLRLIGAWSAISRSGAIDNGFKHDVLLEAGRPTGQVFEEA